MQLIVDEGHSHSIKERNEVRRFVIIHLLKALHEHESAIAGQAIFVELMNKPTAVTGILNAAVVCTHSFKFDFDISSVGSSNSELFLIVNFQ